jgi:hypothetical protein
MIALPWKRRRRSNSGCSPLPIGRSERALKFYVTVEWIRPLIPGYSTRISAACEPTDEATEVIMMEGQLDGSEIGYR